MPSTLMVDQPKPFGVFYQGHTVGDLQLGQMCLLNCSSSVVQLIESYVSNSHIGFDPDCECH